MGASVRTGSSHEGSDHPPLDAPRQALHPYDGDNWEPGGKVGPSFARGENNGEKTKRPLRPGGG